MTGAGEETRGQHTDIRARAEAATEGPWIADPDSPDKVFRPDKGGSWDGKAIATVQHDDYGLFEEADAEFIAHARTDLPLVLDELDAALATIAAVRAVLEAWDATDHLVAKAFAVTIRNALDGADTGHGDQQ